jgi:hypothetical protein
MQVKQLITDFNFQYIDAVGEADEMCAMLVHQHVAWACMSDDMDMFVYGCPRVIRSLNIKTHSFMVYDLDRILFAMDLTQENLYKYILISMAITLWVKNVNVSFFIEPDSLLHFLNKYLLRNRTPI